MDLVATAQPCLFLWLLVITHGVASSTNTKAVTVYSVLRNIDYNSMRATINSSYSHVRGVIVHSHCSALCSSDDLCMSFIHDGDSQTCWMFSDFQRCPLIPRYEENSIIYAENKTEMEEDCCSGDDADPASRVYRDCQDAFEAGDIKHRHVYHLSPGGSTVVRAVCEFDTAGGWTVIQKRQDGSVDFYRDYANFTSGFGVLCREYWLGLENMYHLSQRNTKLSIYLEDHTGDYRIANYSYFNIDSNFTLHVSGYSGDARDSLRYHDGRGFSAPDYIAPGSSASCGRRFGGWWFGGCHQSQLNGLWRAGGKVRSTAEGIMWVHWRGNQYTLKKVTMRIGV